MRVKVSMKEQSHRGSKNEVQSMEILIKDMGELGPLESN